MCRSTRSALGWCVARRTGWSSVRAHLSGRDDGSAIVGPLLERCANRFADLLETA
jgi:hypothetical protein